MKAQRSIAFLIVLCLSNTIVLGQGAPRSSQGQTKRTKAPQLTPQQRHFKQIDQFIAEGKPQDALSEVGAMLQEFPIDLEVNNKAYQVYLAFGKRQESTALLVTMMEKFPGNSEVLYKAFETYSLQGDATKGEQYLVQSIAATTDEPLKAERQKTLAQILAKREEAARLKAEAEAKAARLAIIEKRVADGGPNEAVADLNRLIDSFPMDADLRFRAHEILAGIERFDEAEKRLNESVEMTSDPETKNQRKLKIEELNYKRELAAERKRKQEIALAYKRVSLLIGDGKVAEGIAGMDAVLKAHPKDPDVQYSSFEVFSAIGDYVAAEHHLNKAIELGVDAQVKNQRQIQFVDLNYRREKAANELLALVSKKLDDVNYPEAVKALEGMDKILLYHQKGYIMRGGLLGIYRRYEEAAKIYKRVLEDPKLDPQTRKDVEELREYCVNKVVNPVTPIEGAKKCHFCGAIQPSKAAYCQVCLAFQHPISLVSWKHVKTAFNWRDSRLASVSYRWEKKHGTRNAFSAIFAGVAAASNQGSTVQYSTQEDESVSRSFAFRFGDQGPEGIDFTSSASGGEVYTYAATAYGGMASNREVGQGGGMQGAFKFDDQLVYPNYPQFDPIFAMAAFKQNILRGFAANSTFDPTLWNEPHLFVLYYDRELRVTKAIECYEYKSAGITGHRVISDRKQFTGPNHKDPLDEASVTLFAYNESGLIKSIRILRNEKETYRREIVYGPEGVIGEKEYSNGSPKPAAQWQYKWKAGKLIEGKVDNKDGDDFTIAFR